MPSIHQVKPVLQEYVWGTSHGSNSAVERLCNSGPMTFISKPERFAELWMGDHPNGMAIVKQGTDEIAMNEYVASKNFSKLKYMFKVLSVDKPLSLQLHPSKEAAELLHREHPNVYKDDNHKPEIAIALSDEFHALAGFRCHAYLRNIVASFPILKSMFFGDAGAAIPSDFTTFVSTAFHSLVTPSESPAMIEECIRMMRHICDEQSAIVDEDVREAMNVFTLLATEHPGDKTVFSAFLMKKYTLKKGECIYLDAGLLHAYLKGDCIECMASSDNVIRGGLTGKYIDIPSLLKYTRFEEGGAHMVTATPLNTNASQYRAPIDDFTIIKVTLGASEKMSLSDITLSSTGVSLGIVLQGSATITSSDGKTIGLQTGDVISIDPCVDGMIEGTEQLELWIATN